jgi:hypothetical protein
MEKLKYGVSMSIGREVSRAQHGLFMILLVMEKLKNLCVNTGGPISVSLILSIFCSSYTDLIVT